MSLTIIENTKIAEGAIANALKSTAADHIVARSSNVYDDEFENGGYQSEINRELKDRITSLGKVVNVKGVYPANTDLSSIEGEDGDFIIVGQKEYVYWTATSSGANGTKWVLLGDVTLVSQELSDLIDVYNNHTHKFTPSGTVSSTFTGTSTSTSNNSLSISYNAGKLTINTSHNHGYTPSGTVSSTFTGTEVDSGVTNRQKNK